jgi:hypothetical protein
MENIHALYCILTSKKVFFTYVSFIFVATLVLRKFAYGSGVGEDEERQLLRLTEQAPILCESPSCAWSYSVLPSPIIAVIRGKA